MKKPLPVMSHVEHAFAFIACAGFLCISSAALPENAIASITAERFSTNPLIALTSSNTDILQGDVAGPSVIKVPSWISSPLGTYYMYFPSHHGTIIHLAYANNIRGPWTIYEPGTLKNTDVASLGFDGHIASPDVHIDETNQRILMYFHGSIGQDQWTSLVCSTDGITFTVHESGMLNKYCYFKVFKWEDTVYAIIKQAGRDAGAIIKSETNDGTTFSKPLFDYIPGHRHGAAAIRGDHLLWFYTRIGDTPERIQVSTFHMIGDYSTWVESDSLEVLKPELDYEGANYPLVPSEAGEAQFVNQLRDPCIYEESGKTYLFYSIAGESGIAGAELTITMREATPVTRFAAVSATTAPLQRKQYIQREYNTLGRRLCTSDKNGHSLKNLTRKRAVAQK